MPPLVSSNASDVKPTAAIAFGTFAGVKGVEMFTHWLPFQTCKAWTELTPHAKLSTPTAILETRPGSMTQDEPFQLYIVELVKLTPHRLPSAPISANESHPVSDCHAVWAALST